MAQLRKPFVPDGPVRAFYDRLHELHVAAGQPSTRELQRRTRSPRRPRGVNPTTIHDVFSSTSFPREEVLGAVVDALGGDVEEFAALLTNARIARIDPARSAEAATPAPVPQELPPDLPAFAGRGDELRHLDGLLDRHTAVTVALVGTAGIGKTTLAVRWGHRAAARFPDGRLYVDLRGYDPAGSPVAATEALRGFLVGLGVAADGIPADLTARVGLYRSLLAGRRVLVVLDNAANAAHVRPLLPGAPGSMALVTSRDQLTGLVAADGALPLVIDLPTADQARHLLTRRLGADRVAAEPDAVAAIVAECARLPLALAVVAARAAIHPMFPLGSIARELGDARGRLDPFTGTDPATDIRAVFSWSYRQLGPAAAALFRLSALHPGRHLTAPAAASLVGEPLSAVRAALAELAGAHLFAEPLPGRFSSHDLLRAYAAELASTLPDAERQAALGRLLDHYSATAHAAAKLLNPHRDPIAVDTPLPGVTVAELRHHDEAMAWFAAEHTAVLALVDHSARHGSTRHTWPLAWTLQDFLDRNGRWEEQAAAQRTALEAVRLLDDRPAQALVHRALAGAYTSLDRRDDARRHYQEALALFDAVGDRVGQANTHLNLGNLHEGAGRYEDALHHARQALAGYRSAAHRAGEANALNAIGWCHSRLGDHRQAITWCTEALALHQEIDDRWGQAYTWDSLGAAHHHTGDHDRAIACYRIATGLQAGLGNRYYEAAALTSLGDVHRTVGAMDDARQAWHQAARILRDLTHPDLADVEARLNDTRPDHHVAG
ncbi:tetratricopeptide repeat protein [Actinosynnema sp. NPDC023794]